MDLSDVLNYRMNLAPLSLDRVVLSTALALPVFYGFLRLLPVTCRNKKNYRKLAAEGLPVEARLVSIRRVAHEEVEAAPVVHTRRFSRYFGDLEFRLHDREIKVQHEFFGDERQLGSPRFAPGSIHEITVLPSEPEKIFFCESFGGFPGEPVPFIKYHMALRNPVRMDGVMRLFAVLFLMGYGCLLFL